MSNTVLIVDDSRVSRMMLAAALHSKDEELRIIEAGDGAQAIDSTQAHAPSLIILDVNMPVMDGFTAAEQIRPLQPAACIVILTANVQAASHKRAEQLGLHFLAKPISEQLADRILTLWRASDV